MEGGVSILKTQLINNIHIITDYTPKHNTQTEAHPFMLL